MMTPSTTQSLVDNLAALQSQAALLDAQIRTVKDALISCGPGKYIGSDFYCNVTKATRSSVPKEVLVAKLERCGVPQSWFTRNTETIEVVTVGKCQPLVEARAKLAGVAA